MKKPKKKRSHQVRYQKAMLKKGMCRQCGSEPVVLNSIYGRLCLIKNRKRMRRKTGSKKWQPGGRGRPPLNSQ